jgi:hypothetical protein
MPKLEKGSQSAKERMAHLRSLRKKKGTGESAAVVEPIMPTPSAVADPSGKGMKQKSPWVKFVANYAKQHNMSFFTALKTDEVVKQYHSQK